MERSWPPTAEPVTDGWADPRVTAESARFESRSEGGPKRAPHKRRPCRQRTPPAFAHHSPVAATTTTDAQRFPYATIPRKPGANTRRAPARMDSI